VLYIPTISSSEQIPWGNLKDYQGFASMVNKLQEDIYLCEWDHLGQIVCIQARISKLAMQEADESSVKMV